MSVKFGTFTVPVDLLVLQACRIERGYTSARKLAAEIHKRGYDLDYRQVEQPDRHGNEKRIRSSTAEIIAEVLDMEPGVVFPQYNDVRAFPAAPVSPVLTWKPSKVYMTLFDLNRLLYLRHDISREQQALRNIKGATPHTKELIAAIKADLQNKEIMFESERERVQRYVDEVEDEYTRKIIKLRFLDGLPWGAVAMQCYACKETVQAKAINYIYRNSGFPN